MRAGATAFLLPFLLYVATRAPDLTFIDSGELAAAAATLGIAHPTGYPLYTLLGRTVCIPPGPLEPIARLTLFSALCGAGAALVVHLTLKRLLLALGLHREAAVAGGLAAALLLAAGLTVWEQAVIVEVYALHLLLIAILFHLALRVAWAEVNPLLFAYLAGLAVGNHLSTLLLLPALVFLIAREVGVSDLWRRAPALGIAFLAGLTIYLYLPVRSALNPPLDWGDPQTLGDFYRHATGAVYRVWFLSGTQVAMKQLARFVELLGAEMTPIALLAAAAGLVLLWRRARAIVEATVLLFLLNLLYAINYDIHDIDSYFLPAFLMVALWAGTGIAFSLDALRRRSIAHSGAMPHAAGGRRSSRLLITAAALALPGLAATWNFGAANQRHNHLVPDYTAAMFASLDPEAVILSRQWDQFCSASIYEQLVRNQRRDVTVLEKELLRRRWYLRQLTRWDPDLTAGCRERMAEFDSALIPFERGEPYDAQVLQNLYVEMINCLLTGAATSRPVYLTPDAIEPGIADGFVMVPSGLAMRLHRERPPAPPPEPVPPPLKSVRDLEPAFAGTDPQRKQLAGLVLEMATRRAIFLFETGHREEAHAQIDRVLERVPTYENAERVREAMHRVSAP